jgi:hypothetical protein
VSRRKKLTALNNYWKLSFLHIYKENKISVVGITINIKHSRDTTYPVYPNDKAEANVSHHHE